MEVHSFPIDEYTLGGRIAVVDGYATPPSGVGIGVEFDWKKLAPHLVD